jgi:hypothetical protein
MLAGKSPDLLAEERVPVTQKWVQRGVVTLGVTFAVIGRFAPRAAGKWRENCCYPADGEGDSVTLARVSRTRLPGREKEALTIANSRRAEASRPSQAFEILH